MVDDVVKKARGDLKKVAARVLARRDEAEQKLAGLTSRRDKLVQDRALAEASGDANLIADVDRSIQSLTEQIELVETEYGEARSTFEQIKEDLNRLDDVEAEAQVQSVRRTADAIATPDPFAPSAEDKALENARNAILDLEARLEVERELAPKPDVSRETERKLRELEAAEREAEARRTLEALKAERKKKTAESEPTEAETADPDKKKRTL